MFLRNIFSHYIMDKHILDEVVGVVKRLIWDAKDMRHDIRLHEKSSYLVESLSSLDVFQRVIALHGLKSDSSPFYKLCMLGAKGKEKKFLACLKDPKVLIELDRVKEGMIDTLVHTECKRQREKLGLNSEEVIHQSFRLISDLAHFHCHCDNMEEGTKSVKMNNLRSEVSNAKASQENLTCICDRVTRDYSPREAKNRSAARGHSELPKCPETEFFYSCCELYQMELIYDVPCNYTTDIVPLMQISDVALITSIAHAASVKFPEKRMGKRLVGAESESY